jgi:hypothetical protein
MQAMLVDSIRPGDWLYEIKFDGYQRARLWFSFLGRQPDNHAVDFRP